MNETGDFMVLSIKRQGASEERQRITDDIVALVKRKDGGERMPAYFEALHDVINLIHRRGEVTRRGGW